MKVEKTFRHRGMTLAHGCFEVCEVVHVCARGCRPGGRRVRRRQAGLADILMPRSTVGYDVMTFVGLERFVHHRQREEIRAALRERYDIVLSSGEVSTLGRRFLVYLEALHVRHAADLRAALAADGGWPLHVDATGEDGRGTLLCVYTGWRRWVLGAWKIPTERADAILPRLRAVEARFGAPCAVMRDLGKAVIEAARDFVGKRRIPVLGCHLHFLKDVGKDLLAGAHDELRALFRRFEVTAHLRALARDLGRRLGADLESAREAVTGWMADPAQGYELPQGQAGLAVVRALAQWVLDFARDGQDEGFPFDLPWLDLYRRCRRACRAAEAFLRAPSDDRNVHQALERFQRIVAGVRSEIPFQRPAATLETRAQLFAELRVALRLRVKPPWGPQSTAPTDPGADATMLQDIKSSLKALEASLRKRRPERGPAQNTREAIDLLLDHLDRHRRSLFGHVIALPESAGGGVRLVDRTNTILESLFHGIKHGERRRSGRKILTQDLEQLPPAAALACNLTRPDYVATICGSLTELPRAFASLDAADRGRSLPARARAPVAEASEPDVVSRSMPAADRDIIRHEALDARVLQAARSRAPRWSQARR
ncbi:MAG: hypothetical protein ACREMR_09015 [Gemmatimonadales bacterium]